MKSLRSSAPLRSMSLLAAVCTGAAIWLRDSPMPGQRRGADDFDCRQFS